MRASWQAPTESAFTFARHKCNANLQLQVVLAHRDKVQIEGASLTKKYLLVNERANASTRMVVHRLHARGAMPSKPLGPGEAITFDEPVYTLSGGGAGGGPRQCAEP